MKLGTLKGGSRDGSLVVVRRDQCVFAPAAGIAPTLQAALDDWPDVEPRLQELARRLNAGQIAGQPVDLAAFAAPLPRTHEWLDGSAFLEHVRLARLARGAALPPNLQTDPLMYQGGGSDLQGPQAPMVLGDLSWGLDFEAECGVITTDVPRGASPSEALGCVRLVVLLNDVTYRGLVPDELAKGFGFVQSKPATAFAPFALTPDELTSTHPWQGRIEGRLRVTLNGQVVGDLDTTAMHFTFAQLVSHAARTRRLGPGTIVGSGTVSNVDPASGFACLAEQRMREILATGKAVTPFLAAGDTIRIEARGVDGADLFGAIEQRVQ